MSTMPADSRQQARVGVLAPQPPPSSCWQRPSIQSDPGKDTKTPVPPPAPTHVYLQPQQHGHLFLGCFSSICASWWGVGWAGVGITLGGLVGRQKGSGLE